MEIPAKFLCSGVQLNVALGVAAEFGCVEGLAHVVDELLFIACEVCVWSFENCFGADAGIFLSGEAAGEDGFGDECCGDAKVECVLAHPFPGAFLAGGIKDEVDEVSTGFAILNGEDVASDFDEVAFEFAFVPFAEHVMEFLVGESNAVFEDVVGFADELHIAVFDAVVDHFDIVSGTGFPDPFAAGDIVVGANFGADFLEHIFDVRPCFGVSTGHDAGAFEGSFFAAGDTGADEAKAFCGELFVSAVGIDVVGVATVDDDVAFGEERLELIDDGVNGGPGLYHDHNATWGGEAVYEVLEGIVAADAVGCAGFDDTWGAGGKAAQEFVGGFRGAVIDTDGKTFVGHIHDKVLAHDGEADETDIVLRHNAIFRVGRREVG